MAVGKREALIPLKVHLLPRTRSASGVKISVVVSIYIYVCERKKNLHRTLEIDSPFQTFAVGLLVEFID